MPNISPPPFRRTLLSWYSTAKRDLPWRQTFDPYRIWISEVMLQQTRVSVVIPYYLRFLERFPTYQTLASAPEDQLLHAWAGLGYYSRARNLQRAAQLMAQSGAFPTTYEAIRDLPGIGDYTAAAVGSIAFNLAHAAIDGNALRVFSRLTAEPGDIGSPATRARLASTAGQLLDPTRPGDFNQAIMELGATICLPRIPLCSECPLTSYCAAYQTHRTADYPVKIRKVQRQEVLENLFYVEQKGRVLLWRRDDSSKRLAGFWELPGSTQLNGAARSLQAAGEFKHTIVNTTFCFRVVRASVRSVPKGLVWVEKKSLYEVPLSTTAKKALRCLEKGSRNEE